MFKYKNQIFEIQILTLIDFLELIFETDLIFLIHLVTWACLILKSAIIYVND